MNILYEDNDILICVKKRGIPVQKDSSAVKSLLEEAEEYTKTSCYVLTRLDRPVGGIVLFAKRKKTAAKLTTLIQERKIDKIYYAVVCGNITGSGRLENYLFKNQRENKTKVVNKGSLGAKLAILDYECIKTVNDMTLVKISLMTGRHHQIRVQMANMGAPLYGDTKYNPQFRFKKNVETALYASGLKFELNGKIIDVNIKPEGQAFECFKL